MRRIEEEEWGRTNDFFCCCLRCIACRRECQTIRKCCKLSTDSSDNNKKITTRNSYNIKTERERERTVRVEVLICRFSEMRLKRQRGLFIFSLRLNFYHNASDCGANWLSWNALLLRLQHHAVQNRECKLVRVGFFFFFSIYTKFVVVH